MTSRNPHYALRHPPNACDARRKDPPLPPALRAREPLEAARPSGYMTRLAHYTEQNAATGRFRLSPAQNRRLTSKANRAKTSPARREAAQARRAQAIAAQQAERNAILLGRVVQLPPIRWGKTVPAQLRSGHRG